ncbi:MAG: phosphate acyltransferase PlsX [Deltaproteobacteria bacterium]|nr:phosphate acyltransferase PlsX [Deltaproteobacteria bacterium]RLB84734.1 MAG: phosphate acyltransferase PlsX [Deltaproteobacteria bacterium]HDM10652.1 phosphate acyltransferase PlsX [Desulfobacteraceae bacterium]
MFVAVDAMGGDFAPDMVVQGAVEAVTEFGISVILVGDEARLKGILGQKRIKDRILTAHSEQVIEMDEPPLKAVRKKQRASIRVAFDLVRDGKAQAVVSAGNSGATVAAGMLILGKLRGVDRPAIAGVFPRDRGPAVLIDVGANVDCRPSHLFQFGIMAKAFASSCLGIEDPRIGLLNIGEEGTKGNEQVRQARELFEKSKLNFIGNVEGRGIFEGDVQIIVCDGFVGNVVLKLSEGMAETVKRTLQGDLRSSFVGRVASALAKKPLASFEDKLDYEIYGGAPLLGINGVSVICHGDSSPRAIKNAIKLASEYANKRLVEKMSAELERLIS